MPICDRGVGAYDPSWRLKMRELKDRLRVLDTADAPNLWLDAARRTPGLLPSMNVDQPSRRSRLIAGSVAMMIFFAGAAFAWSALRPTSSVGPTKASPSATVSTLPGTIALAAPNGTLLSPKIPGGDAVFLSPTRLAMSAAGSGSCPELPTDLKVMSPHTLRMTVDMWNPTNGPCTADLRSTSFEVAIDPTMVDVTHNVTIHLVYTGPSGSHRTVIAPGL
jgi:hypothetical protein